MLTVGVALGLSDRPIASVVAAGWDLTGSPEGFAGTLLAGLVWLVDLLGISIPTFGAVVLVLLGALTEALMAVAPQPVGRTTTYRGKRTKAR